MDTQREILGRWKEHDVPLRGKWVLMFVCNRARFQLLHVNCQTGLSGQFEFTESTGWSLPKLAGVNL